MKKIEFANSAERTGETVGGRLRDARLSKGYSVEELAIATGLTEAEIVAIEDGTSVDAHDVERIARVLG